MRIALTRLSFAELPWVSASASAVNAWPWLGRYATKLAHTLRFIRASRTCRLFGLSSRAAMYNNEVLCP
jgi:hypothetical protein